MTKKKEEKKIKMKKNVRTDTTNVQKITKNYNEKLYAGSWKA